MRRSRHVGARSAQRGVGLIEVMVAVLVLSIAILGIAALQATSLSTNTSASMRSTATIASYSIMDAMRADRSNAISGNYNTTSSGPLKANACGSDMSTLIATQKRAWCLQLGDYFGTTADTTGAIDCDDTGACTITITYDDNRSGKATPASSSSSGTTESQQVVVTKGML